MRYACSDVLTLAGNLSSFQQEPLSPCICSFLQVQSKAFSHHLQQLVSSLRGCFHSFGRIFDQGFHQALCHTCHAVLGGHTKLPFYCQIFIKAFALPDGFFCCPLSSVSPYVSSRGDWSVLTYLFWIVDSKLFIKTALMCSNANVIGLFYQI